MTSIITLRIRWQTIDVFAPKMRFLNNYVLLNIRAPALLNLLNERRKALIGGLVPDAYL